MSKLNIDTNFSQGGGQRNFSSPVTFINVIKRFFTGVQNDSLKQLSSKAAFTLAEVLITLGIIGVVAAMTIPSIVAKYQKMVTATRVKAFYSKINQAYTMSYAFNGDTVDWVVLGKTYTYEESVNWLKKYIFPYMKPLSIQNSVSSLGEQGVLVKLKDGSVYWFQIDRNGQDVAYYPHGKVNINPREKFQFNFAKRLYDGSTQRQSMNLLEPYIFNWNGRRTQLFTDGTFGCYKGCSNCAYCTKLLQLNNWEFPDDYPW